MWMWVGEIRHKGLENILQFEPPPEYTRRGSARHLTIEREVEFAKSSGATYTWKAYGLEQITLTVAPTVYPPREDSILLDQVLAELGPGGGRRLLEIGCGSGAVSLSCSIRDWVVNACDVNPMAVASTLGNASEYDCPIDVVEGGPGDTMTWIPEEGVDVIAWNLPYLDPTPGEHLGPLEDFSLIEQQGDLALLSALQEQPQILNPGGVVYLLHSSNRLGVRIPTAWRASGWATRNVQQVCVGDEILTVIACWRPFERAEILRLESCESTNDEILNNGGVEGKLITTAKQTAGRGYRNRNWVGSERNFMGSWSLHNKSIERGPEFIQFAATLSVLDTIAVFKNHGLPTHSWIHCSALETDGVRVKWPNDIWLRTPTRIGKLCGILAQGRTQGDQTYIALGIGLNQTAVAEVEDSIGWNEMFGAELDELIPILHASIASTLEIHELVKSIPKDDVHRIVFSAMRMTFCEGEPRSFGIDVSGGLLGVDQITRFNGDWNWNWN